MSQNRKNELLHALNEISKISNDTWLGSLEDRKRKELEFHDQERDRSRIASLDVDTFERFYGNKKYYKATGASKEYVEKWIENNVRGKIFLDYACGNGFNAINAAKAGADLAIGIDLSAVSIENARRDAESAGVMHATYFVQADAENTLLPESSIDCIICSGMLHHLDLDKAFPELQRILAPGGKILAIEALDYNPFIKLYRYITPEMRTEWEKAHILSLADIRHAKKYFNVTSIKYWHMASILGAFVPSLLGVFNVIDSVFTRIPILKLWSWMFTFELSSRK